MANSILLTSSLFFGSMQLFYVYTYIDREFGLFVLLGVLTSIFNHGSSIEIIKYLDRITMYIGYILNTIILLEFNLLYYILILNLAVLFYLIAKILNSSFMHVLSHMLIMFVNIYILAN